MYGLGPLEPNTIILGDRDQPSVREAYGRMVTQFHQSRRNVMIVRDDPGRGFGSKARIDARWGGLQANGSLMMLFAYLLSRNVQWSQATVHITLVVLTAEAADSARATLQSIIGGLRIGATPHVLVANGRQFPQILRDSSSHADLIFLGLVTPDEDIVAYYQRMHALVLGLPSTVFVLDGQDLNVSDVLL